MRIHRAARAMYPNGARERSKDCCMWSDAIPPQSREAPIAPVTSPWGLPKNEGVKTRGRAVLLWPILGEF